MMEKFDEILSQATRELHATVQLFEAHKDCPPVYKNYPPEAGAIAWARALYHKQKKPILKFRTHEDLLKRPQGEAYKQEYLAFAKAIHRYCDKHYKDWADEVHNTATDNLKQPILGPDMLARKLHPSEYPRLTGPSAVSVGVLASAAAGELAASTGGADVDAELMPVPPYFVNFR